jgi:tetratricopeptide (TPR) repeat protein
VPLVTPLSRRLRVLGAVLVLGAAGAPARADDGWVRVRSAHFEVLSDAAPERARAAAVRLERFRRVLTDVFKSIPGGEDVPTVVIAFRGQASFAPFLPLYRGHAQDVEGYFQAGSDRDYIAASIADDLEDPCETLFHEYAHVLLNRTLSAQPLWLGEGLAEVFSRWSADGGDALLGRPALDHVRRLQRAKLLPVSRVLRLDYASPVYNEGDERALFYAESWALAHWALFGRGATGPADLQLFLAAIANGEDAEHAFASAFGADASTAERLLPAYLAGPLPVGRFSVAGLEADVVVEAETARPAEVEYRLGDLLLHGGRLAEARRHLERAVESDPRFAPPHAALASAALRQARWAEARREVGLALAGDPADALALSRYAEMLVRETAARGEILEGERETEAIASLERALALSPGLPDAAELLARLKPEPGAERIRQVQAAMARDPTRTELGLTLAGLYARQNDFVAARAALVRTRATVHDETNRFLSDHLLERLDRYTAGTAEVQGTLVALDCLAGGALRFVVAGPAERLRLDAPSAVGVFLYGRDGSQIERTFTCGAQSDRVIARYRPSPAGTPEAADGTLMSLTFESR